MKALFWQEIKTFFTGLTGYIVLIVFLTTVGLFMWVIPGDLNQLNRGYAEMDTFFFIAPWVFLFLVPAITMRTISEEKRNGTLELLLTRPLNETKIVLAKFIASCALLVFALLPTLIYYFTIKNLAEPVGNVDTGGIMGSYIGLILLGFCFCAVGIFASSLSDNQVFSFILALFISFALYVGISMLATFKAVGPADDWMKFISLEEHYMSLSRGVADTRDILYLLGVMSIFLSFTIFSIQKRKW